MKWRREQLPGFLDFGDYHNSSGNPTWITFFFVFSKGMLYEKPQYDPVFPGYLPLIDPDTNQTMFKEIPKNSSDPIAYTNYDARPSIIGCIEDVYICSSEAGECVEGLNNYINFEGIGKPVAQTQFDGSETSEQDITHFLLSHALLDIGIGGNVDPECYEVNTSQDLVALYVSGTMSTRSKSRGFITLHRNLPQGHWKEIVRRAFETSLANSQFNVLNIVRGNHRGAHDGGKSYGKIPHRFRGLCKMGKFYSVGWRNVSVSGFLGLLGLSALITLASVRTEGYDLWVTVWARSLTRLMKWIVLKISTIPWKAVLTHVSAWIHRVLPRIPRKWTSNDLEA